ncbi:hypothetical protein [Citrobacter sedlakii]|uniref:hypothetical protein n=1 Tax=Citrobacter sedlakii TaxID=67826 RepID=UPI00333B676E
MSNIDKHIDKQALRDQSVEGSFYLVECCNCGEMYPSNLLDGGEAIADSGDYGDCYCHLCGADDTERADWGDVNSNEAKAWNFQQKRIEALLDELEAAEKRIAEQSEIMRQAASNISYAIFNLTGSDLSRLKPGVVESTDPTDTALIAERSLRAAAGKGESS